MRLGHLDFDDDTMHSLCERWGVERLEAFGSVLREDFGPESDVDLLITFKTGRKLGLDAWTELQGELEQMLGRPVDLAQPAQLKWVIRDRVLREARLVYAA